jgi:hypothetical protein
VATGAGIVFNFTQDPPGLPLAMSHLGLVSPFDAEQSRPADLCGILIICG